MMPRLPGIGSQVNGAFLAVRVGPVQFQPAEFAKIAIVIFLASYLRDTGDVLVRGRQTPLSPAQQVRCSRCPPASVAFVVLVLGPGPAEIVLVAVFAASVTAVLRERPSLKHFGPLLLVWGLAMFMLLFIRDLGSSLMFFGAFLALLYVATARLSLVGIGATLFLGGATYLAGTVGHVQDRIDVWRTRSTRTCWRRRGALPDRPGPVRASRRRVVRAGLRTGAAPAARRPTPRSCRPPTPT